MRGFLRERNLESYHFHRPRNTDVCFFDPEETTFCFFVEVKNS